MIDYIIEKLTELLIKQDFKEKEQGIKEYCSKIECYRDLIRFLKENKEIIGGKEC
jgi:hypothetical protein